MNTSAPGRNTLALVTFGLSTTSTLVIVTMAVAGLALVIAVSAHLRISTIHARYRDLWAHGEKDLIAVVSHQSASIAHMQDEVAAVRAQLARTMGDDMQRGEVPLTPQQQQSVDDARTGKGST
jgi:hypothetical protein